ncbi:hypothetical protein HPHPA20_0755 [Helicobacter pylori Hp A-20]|nr:hypothetical protein HPHPA20_0755 [Helicobacter pylori Hp A-20]
MFAHRSYFLSCIVFHLASCLKQVAAYIDYQGIFAQRLIQKRFLLKVFQIHSFYRNFAIIRVILRSF